jgi:hypothetical protein
MELTSLQRLLKEELSEQDSFTWPARFRDQMDDYLIEPFRCQMLNPDSKEIESFWVVADERPGEEGDGCFIVYSEEADLFGLATKTPELEETSGTLIGLYGSMADTLIELAG